MHDIYHRYLPSSLFGDQCILAIELFKPLNLPLENTPSSSTSAASSSSSSQLLPVSMSNGVVGIREDAEGTVSNQRKATDTESILRNKFIIIVDTKDVITSIVTEVSHVPRL